MILGGIDPLYMHLDKNLTFAPPSLSFWSSVQCNITQKIIFLMKIYDYKNENIVKSEKLEKKQFYYFQPCHLGVLCTKTLTLNRNPLIWSDFENFHIF